MQVEKEVWEPCEGYSGYWVSSYGRVVDDRGEPVKPYVGARKSVYVQLGDHKPVRLDVLVATAFLGMQEGDGVYHMDKHASNSVASNLRVATKEQRSNPDILSMLKQHANPIRSVKTGKLFGSTYEVEVEYGVNRRKIPTYIKHGRELPDGDILVYDELFRRYECQEYS